MARVLVIRLGFRDGLAGFVSRAVSLESVVRATPILRAFVVDDVTWVTSREALPLISGARGVTRALGYDAAASLELAGASFDVVVNLESAWEFCALAESVSAPVRFGFALDAGGERVVALAGAEDLLAWERSPAARRRETRAHPELLFRALGREWAGEPYAIGLVPANREEFDVGLNLASDAADAMTAWPASHWERLATLLDGRLSVSRGISPAGLGGYLHWLNACRIVVSPDSLGLHLALALGKKVVGLFGATSASACPTFGRGVLLTPAVKLNCIPCSDAECRFARPCVATITPEQVAEAVGQLLSTGVAAT